MRLCLVRHAKAEERGPAWPDDRLRPLSAKGWSRMETAALGLTALVEPALIVSSPLVRAAQTAEILQKAFHLPGVHFSDALCSGDPEAMLQELNRQPASDLLVVGHEPDISELLSTLLAASPALVRSRFGTGAAALTESDGALAPGTSVLHGLFQNRVLRRLGRAPG